MYMRDTKYTKARKLRSIFIGAARCSSLYCCRLFVALFALGHTNSPAEHFFRTNNNELEFMGCNTLKKEIYSGDWRQITPMRNVFWLHYMAKEWLLEKRKKSKNKGLCKLWRKVLIDYFTAIKLSRRKIWCPYSMFFRDRRRRRMFNSYHAAEGSWTGFISRNVMFLKRVWIVQPMIKA